MAAANANKPGWVHYSFIASILLCLILGVLVWMQTSAINESTAKWQADQKAAQDAKNASARALEQIDNLKKVIGHGFETIGAPGDQNANSVVGAMLADVARTGNMAQPTYKETLNKLVEENARLIALRDDRDATIRDKDSQIARLQGEYQQKVDTEQKAKEDSESTLATKTQQSAEERAAKDKEIEDKNALLKEVQDELATLEDNFKKTVENRDKRITNLVENIKRLKGELDQLRNYSFEVADGKIISIDHIDRTVTVNLGKADKLAERVTFAVYSKGHSGVARGKEDIKGQIEVIEILGPHLAKARIMDELPDDPISPYDPVYTPMWSAGRTEAFALVGRFDLDGDGKDDRELLYDLVTANGARIDTDVDMKGTRTGKTITNETKFLVIGEVPDSTQVQDPEEKRAFEEIANQRKILKQEADESGVTTVTMNNFLSWMGYRPQHKIFRPGDIRQNALSNGARSLTVGSPLGQRISTGAVSDAMQSTTIGKPKYDPQDPRRKVKQ